MNDYADTQFSNFAIEYLHEKKVCETVFASSYGAQVKSFKQKKMVENLVTLSDCPFNHSSYCVGSSMVPP